MDQAVRGSPPATAPGGSMERSSRQRLKRSLYLVVAFDRPGILRTGLAH